MQNGLDEIVCWFCLGVLAFKHHHFYFRWGCTKKIHINCGKVQILPWSMARLLLLEDFSVGLGVIRNTSLLRQTYDVVIQVYI